MKFRRNLLFKEIYGGYWLLMVMGVVSKKVRVWLSSVVNRYIGMRDIRFIVL